MSNHYQTARATTITTTGNIDDLDFSKAGLIRMNNASDATIRGLKAGWDGQEVTILSVGAGNVFLEHQNSNSTAANRLVNLATSAKSPLAAGAGSATYIYDATTERWRMKGHDQGAFLTPTFDAGDFTAAGSMTWTVAEADVVRMNYFLKGNLLFVSFRLATTSVGGTLNPNLHIGNGQWGDFLANSASYAPTSFARDAGTFITGHFFSDETDNTFLTVRKPDVSNWSSATNTTYVYGQIYFTVL